MSEYPKDAIPVVTAALLQIVCRRDVSFATLAKASTSRAAIAAAIGITSFSRRFVILKAAKALGFEGVISV